MLESHDLMGTVSFYVETLGFNCDAYEEGWGWASLSLDNVHIMFTTPNPHRRLGKAIMSGSLYIRTNAVENLWHMLRERLRSVLNLRNSSMVCMSLPSMIITDTFYSSGRKSLQMHPFTDLHAD